MNRRSLLSALVGASVSSAVGLPESAPPAASPFSLLKEDQNLSWWSGRSGLWQIKWHDWKDVPNSLSIKGHWIAGPFRENSDKVDLGLRRIDWDRVPIYSAYPGVIGPVVMGENFDWRRQEHQFAITRTSDGKNRNDARMDALVRLWSLMSFKVELIDWKTKFDDKFSYAKNYWVFNRYQPDVMDRMAERYPVAVAGRIAHASKGETS